MTDTQASPEIVEELVDDFISGFTPPAGPHAFRETVVEIIEFALAASSTNVATRLSEAATTIKRLREALEELLSGHDNLYVALFGPYSDPRADIAAKPARDLLAAMRPNERGE